jgi:hypothetical protein
VVHRWGHATRARPDLERVEPRSRRRFQRRNYPALARWAIRWLDRRPHNVGVVASPVSDAASVPTDEAELWLLSPFRHLTPAAGCRGALSPAVHELGRDGRWFLAAAGRERGRWQISSCWTWGQP